MRIPRSAKGMIVVSALGVASLSVFAQGPPSGAGPVGDLTLRIAALEARVDSLEAAPPGGGALKVLDATNKVLGFWMADDDFDLVALLNGHWVGMEVQADGFESQSGTTVWFTSSDCTGTPMLDAEGLARRGRVVGQTVYYPGDPITNVAIGSRGNLQADGSVTGCSVTEFTLFAGPVNAYDLAGLGATAPFRIAAQ